MLRECTVVVETQYDPQSGEFPTTVIAKALACASGVDATDLPLLYEAIDPDALDRLFRRNGDAAGEALVRFTVDDWHVFVRDDGRVRVCDATQRTAPTPVFGGDETVESVQFSSA